MYLRKILEADNATNMQEIVNNKSTGDVAGNVLLVTIEGVEAGDVSIDVIHLSSSILSRS
ncbi:hypothetical protein KSP39_PZI020077 [Platanthera zijinensis]|uniref:Uncharacterized protein n=1 Tax=Platanthera zijinensis TaxID=2320716 RepID=A0AAP0AZJ8_9ASPA